MDGFTKSYYSNVMISGRSGIDMSAEMSYARPYILEMLDEDGLPKVPVSLLKETVRKVHVPVTSDHRSWNQDRLPLATFSVRIGPVVGHHAEGEVRHMTFDVPKNPHGLMIGRRFDVETIGSAVINGMMPPILTVVEKQHPNRGIVVAGSLTAATVGLTAAAATAAALHRHKG